jgi:hypothetical protein
MTLIVTDMLIDLRQNYTLAELSVKLKISSSSLLRYYNGQPVKNENIYNIIKNFWEKPT